VVAALDSPYTKAATPGRRGDRAGQVEPPGALPEAGRTQVTRAATASPIGALTKNTHRQLA
jgi:hypothetical protein